MEHMKKLMALVTVICMTAGFDPAPGVSAEETVLSVNGTECRLNTEPYENSLGLMADARELAEAFGTEYSFDAQAKALTMHDDTHGDIILVHNATEFYSGENIFECLPYFYVENGIPMAEIGFFCEMFDKSYSRRGDVIEITDGRAELLEDDAEPESDERARTGGTLSGSLTVGSGEEVVGSIDVKLMIRSMSRTKYDHYGVASYAAGKDYTLGSLHMDEGETSKEYSYDLSGYYDESYPCYTIYYSAQTESPNIARYGYYTEGNEIKARFSPFETLAGIPKDTGAFDIAGDYANVELKLPVLSGLWRGIYWDLDAETGRLTISGSGLLSAGGPWEEFKSQIKSIVFEKCGMTIGEEAFSGYSALKSVEIKPNVVAINDKAFCGCSSLESVSIEGNLYTIGDRVFQDCRSLKKVELPDFSTKMGEYIFFRCSSLTDVKLSDSLSQLGEATFANCTSLENIGFPAIKSMPYGTFYGCTALKNVEIPDTVVSIGGRAFYGCSSLTQIKLPDNLAGFGTLCFNECTSLRSIEIPEKVTTIPWAAFSGCTRLWNVKLPGGIKKIEAYAFQECRALKNLELGALVEIVGKGAFEGCGFESFTIPENAEVGDGLLEGCVSLREIKLNSKMTELPNMMFQGCSSLEKVTLPSSITSIGFQAFYGCQSFKELHVEGTIRYVGTYITSYSSGLNVYYPKDNEESVYNLRAAYPNYTYIAEGINRPEPTAKPTEQPTDEPTAKPTEQATAEPDKLALSAHSGTDEEGKLIISVELTKGVNEKLIAAQYDAGGRLIAVVAIQTQEDKRDYDIVMNDAEGSSAVVMLWHDMKEPMPLTASAAVR